MTRVKPWRGRRWYPLAQRMAAATVQRRGIHPMHHVTSTSCIQQCCRTHSHNEACRVVGDVHAAAPGRRMCPAGAPSFWTTTSTTTTTVALRLPLTILLMQICQRAVCICPPRAPRRCPLQGILRRFDRVASCLRRLHHRAQRQRPRPNMSQACAHVCATASWPCAIVSPGSKRWCGTPCQAGQGGHGAGGGGTGLRPRAPPFRPTSCTPH